MGDTPLHSAGFPGRLCSLMDLNGCVVTCMCFPLLFEPLKIYHHAHSGSLDDVLLAVNTQGKKRVESSSDFTEDF